MKIKKLIEVLEIIYKHNPEASIYEGWKGEYDITYYNYSDPLYERLPPYISSEETKKLKELGVNFKNENGIKTWTGVYNEPKIN